MNNLPEVLRRIRELDRKYYNEEMKRHVETSDSTTTNDSLSQCDQPTIAGERTDTISPGSETNGKDS